MEITTPCEPARLGEAIAGYIAHHALGLMRHPGSTLDNNGAHLSYPHCRYGGRPFRMFRWVLKCYVPARPHIYPS